MQKSRPHFARGVLFALIGGVSWAFSGTCAEFLFETQHLSPAWLTSVRCMISGVVFLILAAIIDRERFLEAAKNKRAWVAFAVNGLFGTVFCQFTYLTSISYTDSGTTTVLSMVGLALVMGYSCRASHRLPRKREVFGLILTLVASCSLQRMATFRVWPCRCPALCGACFRPWALLHTTSSR